METLTTTVLSTISELKLWRTAAKVAGKSVGFVPTMGALHQGHLSLIHQAKTKTDLVVASIFVNPTQFNNPDDLKNYPRTVERDLELLSASGCDALFLPTVEEMYPTPRKDHWDFGALSTSLEGHFRPGHFDGMLTVVKMLLELVEPEVAIFGQKDFQQLALIRAMVAHEGLPYRIEAGATVRESGGLAMSSRNMRLTPEQRQQALAISATLFAMKENRASMSPREVQDFGIQKLQSAPGVRLEYLSVVDGLTFQPLNEWSSAEPTALVAAYVGEVRLIDNLLLL